MARIGRISVRGALKLAGWTLSGTLGCLAISLFYNWLSFRHMGGEALRQSLISATVLPIILAGPLFCYLTLKMRELAIANHRLHRLASTDALTACLNRGAFSAIARSPLRHLSQRRLCSRCTERRRSARGNGVLAAVVVEAASGLAPEPAGLDILHQQRARPVLGV